MKREINFIKDIFSKKPENVNFFITTNCNFRCKTCFYWKSLGKGDLSWKEMKKVIRNFPNGLKSVSLSGGEPFLSKNLQEIILELKKKGVKFVGIPTNASLPQIPKILEEILQKNKDLEFLLTISLDGLEKTNDEIRMKGGFKKSLSNLDKIKELRKKFKNLKIQITTTINSLNYEELPEFIEFVKKLNVDMHAFDWMRGEHQGILKLPPKEKFKEISDLLRKTSRHYNNKKSKFHQFYSNLKRNKIIQTQENVLCGKKWNYRCLAGKVEFAVEVNGDLRICELLPPVGNLRENSFEEIMNSEKAKKLFKMIKTHKCDCTHICFVSSSLDHSPLGILKMFFGK